MAEGRVTTVAAVFLLSDYWLLLLSNFVSKKQSYNKFTSLTYFDAKGTTKSLSGRVIHPTIIPTLPTEEYHIMSRGFSHFSTKKSRNHISAPATQAQACHTVAEALWWGTAWLSGESSCWRNINRETILKLLLKVISSVPLYSGSFVQTSLFSWCGAQEGCRDERRKALTRDWSIPLLEVTELSKLQLSDCWTEFPAMFCRCSRRRLPESSCPGKPHRSAFELLQTSVERFPNERGREKLKTGSIVAPCFVVIVLNRWEFSSPISRTEWLKHDNFILMLFWATFEWQSLRYAPQFYRETRDRKSVV